MTSLHQQIHAITAILKNMFGISSYRRRSLKLKHVVLFLQQIHVPYVLLCHQFTRSPDLAMLPLQLQEIQKHKI